MKKFKLEHDITIGVEFLAKNITLNAYNIRLQIWDTVNKTLTKAGQEAFQSIARSYYKNSAAAIIVYDISNRETFDNLTYWIDETRERSPQTVVFVLVGNKSDLYEGSMELIQKTGNN